VAEGVEFVEGGELVEEEETVLAGLAKFKVCTVIISIAFSNKDI